MRHMFHWKVVRWILLGILLILIALQFVPVDRVNPPVETEVPAPAHVRVIVRRACYDCYSNETVWPWYSHVAPFSWRLARDVRTTPGVGLHPETRRSPAPRPALPPDMCPWALTG
jgi:hypothetical protein